jgi:hypothetical protein
MTRTLAFLAAILMTTVTVTSSCLANSPEDLRFTLQPSERRADQVNLSIRSGREARHNGMTSSFEVAELTGLDASRLISGGPVSFALLREAGRVDCAGDASGRKAEGGCRFTADQSFSNFLVANGMQRPTIEQSYDMTLVGVRRDLLSALRTANYPVPSVEDYIELSAVGVTPAYIADLARAGYRPSNLDDLVEFRAVGVTPEFLGSMARAGYANMPANKVVELAAVGVSPAFIRSFEQLGYRDLPVDKLVELKALAITPEFVRGFERIGYARLPVDTLVQLKALDVTPGYVLQVRNGLMRSASLDQVVQLKAMGFALDGKHR